MKRKIRMYKMNTEAGEIPVVFCTFTGLNRKTVLYYASKNGASVFWIVRPKDCEKLEQIGYIVKSIIVPAGSYPMALNYDPVKLQHSIF